ncbi:MAG: type II toxin-antitoxin system RelE/ParE family toxin [Gammaproteobacteria bacterium]|nr:type II toxin-antitoxin system RelE/ParE family toxin [Gammaproteobacteria bacterium]
MYKVVYRKQVARMLAKMPKATARRFLTAFDALATGQSSGLDVKKLMGRAGYRLRIGEWRALYRMEKDQLIIEVVKIGPRGDIYK